MFDMKDFSMIEKFEMPSAHEFATKHFEPLAWSALNKEVDELTDDEKMAIRFFAKVPMKIEKGDTPNSIKWVTDCEVGIQKIDGKFNVLIAQHSLPKHPYDSARQRPDRIPTPQGG